jgi:hypothetical protein
MLRTIDEHAGSIIAVLREASRARCTVGAAGETRSGAKPGG